MDAKDSNPKTAMGAPKPAMSYVPPVALAQLAGAHRHGAEKYGAFNWRDLGVSESVYYSAAHRHLMAWWDGENIDPESGCHHLAHVMACCAIVLDAQAIGKLADDRPMPGGFSKVSQELTDERIARAVETARPFVPKKAVEQAAAKMGAELRDVAQAAERVLQPGGEVSFRTVPRGLGIRVECADEVDEWPPGTSPSELQLVAAAVPKVPDAIDPVFISPDLPYRRKEWARDIGMVEMDDLAELHWTRIGEVVFIRGRKWQHVTHDVYHRCSAYENRPDRFASVRLVPDAHPESCWVPLR